MKPCRSSICALSLGSALALAALVLCDPSRAEAFVLGGGPPRSDCYAAWQVTQPALGPTKGTRVDCEDGDRQCDVDGTANGSCAIGVSVCAHQGEGATCTAPDVTAVRLTGQSRRRGLTLPPLPASEPVCGTATIVTVALRRRGRKPSKPVKLGLVATATGTPPTDRDTLVLRCVPNRGAGECPANPDGGVRELSLVVPESGTDLDNGWTGISHNFPIVFGTTLRACLRGCSDANPACTGDETATDAVNGRTFGPPLPLLAVSSNCIVSRFGSPKLKAIEANVQTGEVHLTMNLEADIYLTPPNQICPRCSGRGIGDAGTCDGGARPGAACRTEGLITVPGATGNTSFALSSDCPPAGTPAGTLRIPVPLTTGTSMIAGPRPCGAAQDDFCGNGTCTAACTGAACDHTTAGGQCVDVKGGISQMCCSSDSTRPCFPTANGGVLTRTGTPAVPAPPLPDPTYPKTATGTLVATSCEEATGATLVDSIVGLPGPGSLILPVMEQWKK